MSPLSNPLPIVCVGDPKLPTLRFPCAVCQQEIPCIRSTQGGDIGIYYMHCCHAPVCYTCANKDKGFNRICRFCKVYSASSYAWKNRLFNGTEGWNRHWIQLIKCVNALEKMPYFIYFMRNLPQKIRIKWEWINTSQTYALYDDFMHSMVTPMILDMWKNFSRMYLPPSVQLGHVQNEFALGRKTQPPWLESLQDLKMSGKYTNLKLNRLQFPFIAIISKRMATVENLDNKALKMILMRYLANLVKF